MIFLRYRTGDYAEYVGDHCSACGRKGPIIRNIQGRWGGKKLFNGDGTYITTTALNLHSDLYSFINGLQYLQQRKGEVKVLIVKSPAYRSEHEKALYRHFGERFAPTTIIRIEYVDKLLRHPNGKFVQVISSVNNPNIRFNEVH
jgi:phenylacetate-CoA ligase